VDGQFAHANALSSDCSSVNLSLLSRDESYELYGVCVCVGGGGGAGLCDSGILLTLQRERQRKWHK
jgi:hypothetical protein